MPQRVPTGWSPDEVTGWYSLNPHNAGKFVDNGLEDSIQIKSGIDQSGNLPQGAEKINLCFHLLKHATIGDGDPDLFGKGHGKGNLRFGELPGVFS